MTWRVTGGGPSAWVERVGVRALPEECKVTPTDRIRLARLVVDVVWRCRLTASRPELQHESAPDFSTWN